MREIFFGNFPPNCSSTKFRRGVCNILQTFTLLRLIPLRGTQPRSSPSSNHRNEPGPERAAHLSKKSIPLTIIPLTISQTGNWRRGTKCLLPVPEFTFEDRPEEQKKSDSCESLSVLRRVFNTPFEHQHHRSHSGMAKWGVRLQWRGDFFIGPRCGKNKARRHAPVSVKPAWRSVCANPEGCGKLAGDNIPGQEHGARLLMNRSPNLTHRASPQTCFCRTPRRRAFWPSRRRARRAPLEVPLKIARDGRA